jgi:hypothetical protein
MGILFREVLEDEWKHGGGGLNHEEARRARKKPFIVVFVDIRAIPESERETIARSTLQTDSGWKPAPQAFESRKHNRRDPILKKTENTD